MNGFVLVVDDELVTRDVLRRMLEGAGFEVAEAKSGVEALEKISQRRPDALLLDVFMPEMDGFTVCTLLRKHRETADLPIILLSARTDLANVAKGLRAGADKYLFKPATLTDLVDTLHEAIGKKTTTGR